MEIKEIINSGILETYVMGIATAEEMEQVLWYKRQYKEVDAALQQIELDMERFAIENGIEPPAGTLAKIEDRINEIQLLKQEVSTPIDFQDFTQAPHEQKSPYIEVESESSHMRIHKAWRWVFAAVFVLGKIFLGFAIYFYLENRQAQQQIQELKIEVNSRKP